MEALRVLVIEQNEEAGLELRRMTASLGHTVIMAVGGEEALSYLQAFAFDAILAEHTLPDMDAITLLDRIRVKVPEPPMVMLMTDGLPERALEAYEHGMCAVLHRPVNAAWLAVAFKRVAEQLELARLRHSQASVPSEEQIAYRFAHAINNPLSVIFGLVQLMLSGDDLPPLLRDDMQVLADNAMRITDIVKNLTHIQPGDGI